MPNQLHFSTHLPCSLFNERRMSDAPWGGGSPYPMGPEAQPIGLLYPTHESTQVKKALKAAKVQR